MPTRAKDSNVPPGIKVVPKRLANGEVRRYCYARANMAPLLHPRSGERLGPDAGYGLLDAALRHAIRPKQAPSSSPGIRSLMDDYRKSPEFRRLAPNTSRRYARVLDEICERFAWLTIDDLGLRKVRQDFHRWRDEMADRPTAADASIDVLCTALEWAYKRGAIEVNHARKIDPLTPPTRHRRDKVWTPDLEKQLLAVARPDVRNVYLLARYTALRQADCCSLEWGVSFDGEWIEMVPEKSRKRGIKVFIPVFALPPLAAHVATLAKEGRLLRSPMGKSVNPPNFRLRLGEDMERAGLGDVDIHFHDLRGTAINDMLNAGATNAEVASISGHVIAEGAQMGFGKYAERSKTLALGAFRKWAAALAGEPKVVQMSGRR